MEIQTFYYAVGVIVATATAIVFVFRNVNKKWGKVDEIERKVNSDLERIETIERQVGLIGMAMSSVLRHLEKGNSTKELKADRKMLDKEFFVPKNRQED